jgi:AmmeMemoRadiSam system protein B
MREAMAMGGPTISAPIRRPAVAGGFYPAERDELIELVAGLLAEAAHPRRATTPAAGALVGILVPHAGLSYSGLVAAAGWRRLERPDQPVPTIVLLGTNHVAGWLDGVAAWDDGAWRTPLGDVDVDVHLAGAIVGLGRPFLVDLAAHSGEHSIEVQLPFIQTVVPAARIVPLAVASGTGPDAVHAGRRLGELLAERRRAGESIVVAISSDMAHYPPAGACSAATETLLPSILALDALGLARTEAGLRRAGVHGLACGMCGIEPAVLGLATLEAMGVRAGTRLASATSADAEGPADRTVGYLAVEFDA